jgi:hypothetical protein
MWSQDRKKEKRKKGWKNLTSWKGREMRRGVIRIRSGR